MAVMCSDLLTAALYETCACLLNFLTYLFTYLFTFLLIYFFENRPIPLQVGCRKRRLNLALVFMLILCCPVFRNARKFDLAVLALVFL